MAFDFGNANEAQRSAISTTDGPLLIIAGPGTGKTYTLVKRIVYLITEKNVLPEEIMIATFTEKAAKELITRITNELYEIGVSVNLNEMYIGTFHSICLRILKDHLEYTRIKKNYRMLDNFDQQYMVFQRINRFRSLPYFDAIFDKKQGAWRQAGEIVKYVNNLAEELVDIEVMMQDSNEQIVAVANIMEQYNILMEDENLIDFSSIQTEAYRLLIEQPSILEEIQQKIKYVMVDEYQDTNYIQELLVFLIAGKNKNICVVGDDDQGLYRFRGATIRNILEFPGHFEEGECKQVKLVTNYRSEKQIIDFYNKWMSTTDGRAYDFLWKNFRFEKKIVPPEGKRDDKVSVIKCSGQDLLDDWYEQVYSFITQLKNSGVLTDYNQIAMLCRSVKGDKITGMIEFLEEHGIKVYSPRSEMFFERKEIKQVIGCMILCFPEYIRKLQQRDFAFDFERLYEYYDTQCIAAAKELILQYRDTLGKWITEKMQKHANLRNDNADYAFTGLLYQLLQFEPFSTYLGIDMKSGVIDERPARNLSILTSILGKYEYLHRIDVFTENNIVDAVERFFNMYFRFLFDGGITEYEDDSEYAPSGCVSFMTIHQSKGMEFPVVIVDSLSGTPKNSANHLIEEIENKYFHREVFETREDIKYFDFWRLYYTAFSRAQNLLVLSCCEKKGHGATPSKYFEECYGKLPSYEDVDLSDLKLETVKPVNIKDTYSFTSHIALYENCALQYKFFKELGFTQVRVGATLFGTLVHETIEDIHRAAMRHEEQTIVPETIREWFDTNYMTLSKSEHSYLGQPQIEAAYNQVLRYVERNQNDWSRIQDAEVEVSLVKPDYILLGKVDLIKGESNANYMVSKVKYSEITLAAEVARYFPDVRCTEIARILRESEEGMQVILDAVNEHNEIIYDKIVPIVFETLYSVDKEIVKENVDVKLLKKPKEGGYYEFSGNEDLIVTQDSDDSVIVKNNGKSFHADTYVFDSKPELQLFLQLLANEHVKQTYFTGMFTADQTDFYVPYVDPESNRLRKYYPDFLVEMDDGKYLILEVKGDHMIDDPIVKAKEAAAEEIAVESSMKYEMIKGTDIMEGKVNIQ